MGSSVPSNPPSMTCRSLLCAATVWMFRVLGLAAAFTPAHAAAPLAYRIEIHAPAELRGMLQEGLTLRRWENDPEMSIELLERLLEDAVRETRQAVATEGYFAPRIETRIDQARVPWLVSID